VSVSVERGNASVPVPTALTNVAAASPAVSATAATAAGIASCSTGTDRPARTRAWSNTHSLTKPLKGGRPMIATPPTANRAAVAGIRRVSPPR
jgi:hypothetical protein